jgi:glycosyltransferase involved in cell wall biosynthesis
MKILLCSVPFHPSVGGIETVARVLAEQFTALGHEVVVVTRTRAAGTQATFDTERPYRIVRGPGATVLLQWMRWCDVVFHNNISLRWAWALAVVHRPWVVAHHVWLPRRGTGAVAARLKRLALPSAHNIAPSRALADDLSVSCEVIPNPYAAQVFFEQPNVERKPDLLYAGRLVSDKGVDLLLAAMVLLVNRGLDPKLSVAGDGPERSALEMQARQLGLATRVRFLGSRTPSELAALMNSHRFLVVPSLWEEPFGLVAIEAIACGCTPIVARSGGLPEAVADCGAVFERADSRDLAHTIERLALGPEAGTRAERAAARARHLASHRPEAVARRYLQAMRLALGARAWTVHA